MYSGSNPFCLACNDHRVQELICTPGVHALLCPECNAIYTRSEISASMKRKKAIAVALAVAGYTLSHRFEILLTARDHEEIVERRIKERVERRNAELATLDSQLNGSVDYLFEPRE